jgi:multiple sugar transport system permease protein
VTFYVFVVQAIASFQVFEQMYVMTEGGPGYATTTVVYEIYREAFQKFHMGYASAIAFVLFVMILAMTLINFKVGGADLEY